MELGDNVRLGCDDPVRALLAPLVMSEHRSVGCWAGGFYGQGVNSFVCLSAWIQNRGSCAAPYFRLAFIRSALGASTGRRPWKGKEVTVFVLFSGLLNLVWVWLLSDFVFCLSVRVFGFLGSACVSECSWPLLPLVEECGSVLSMVRDCRVKGRS